MKAQRALDRRLREAREYDEAVREEAAMPRVETRYEHIVLEGPVPFISGTQMKVVELVEQSRAWGWNPEELQVHHSFLTLGQIHSALAYYWDHKDELDREIDRRLQSSDRLRAETASSPFRERLKARGLL